MKLAATFAAGLLVGALLAGLLFPRSGRFTFHSGAGYLVRFDTATGQTWFDSPTNGWVEFGKSAVSRGVSHGERRDKASQ